MFVAAVSRYYRPVQRRTFPELHYCGKYPVWNDDILRSDTRYPDPLGVATGASNWSASSNYQPSLMLGAVEPISFYSAFDAVEKGKNELIEFFTCAPVETVIL